MELDKYGYGDTQAKIALYYENLSATEVIKTTEALSNEIQHRVDKFVGVGACLMKFLKDRLLLELDDYTASVVSDVHPYVTICRLVRG